MSRVNPFKATGSRNPSCGRRIIAEMQRRKRARVRYIEVTEKPRSRHSWLWVILAVVALCALAAFLTGCKSSSVPVITATENTRIETKIERIYTTDTVYIDLPHQVAERVTPDSISFLENDFCFSLARIDDGLLFHSLETKGYQFPAEVQTLTVNKDSIIEKEVEIRVPEPYAVEVERSLTSWQKFQLRGFWVLLCVALAAVAWNYRKPLLKVISRIIPT